MLKFVFAKAYKSLLSTANFKQMCCFNMAWKIIELRDAGCKKCKLFKICLSMETVVYGGVGWKRGEGWGTECEFFKCNLYGVIAFSMRLHFLQSWSTGRRRRTERYAKFEWEVLLAFFGPRSRTFYRHTGRLYLRTRCHLLLTSLHDCNKILKAFYLSQTLYNKISLLFSLFRTHYVMICVEEFTISC